MDLPATWLGHRSHFQTGKQTFGESNRPLPSTRWASHSLSAGCSGSAGEPAWPGPDPAPAS